jgi:hypothetical protein
MVRKYSGLMIILIAVGGILASMGMTKQTHNAKLDYTDIELEGVQIRRSNEKRIDDASTRTDLEVVLYLTNDGEVKSGKISVDAYIRSFDTLGRETPSNASDTANLGKVDKNCTGRTQLNFQELLFRQDEKYTLDFYIWEDHKVVDKGSTDIKIPYIEFEPVPDAGHTKAAVECVVTYREPRKTRERTRPMPRKASILRPYY